MQDACARDITYLRLSVTDLCDLRCRYCMPVEGICKRSHSEICSVEELVEITRQAVALGVRKICLTGGEPLVRRGIAALEGVDELCLTRRYRVPGGIGLVGLIEPMSHRFCDRCDRIRVTADGKLKPCLHSGQEIPLRGLTGEALREAIRKGITAKPH